MKGRPKTTEAVGAVESRSELYSALSSERRREVLAVLLRQGPALPTTRLAASVAAREADTPVASVTDAERRDVQVDCRHVHLPKLTEAGLLEWDREDGTVRLEREDLLRRRDVEPIVRGRTDVDAETTSSTLDLLEDERRRVALTALEHAGSMALQELATRVVAREHVGKVTDGKQKRVAVALKHVHLPKLAEAGVVSVDGDEVTYRGNALLEETDLL